MNPPDNERDILTEAFAALREETRDRDVVKEAATALREETATPPRIDTARAARTRRAVLAGRAPSWRRRRTLILRVVLPLAAVLAAPFAWATATGRLPHYVSSVSEVLRGEREHQHTDTPPSAPTTPASPHSNQKPVVSTAPSQEPVPTLPAEPSAVTVAAKPPPIHPAPTIAAVAPSASVAMVDVEETLYRSAHELHFVTKDPPNALLAWDAYLRAYPTGRFTPEATYNRALTLVRLGRKDEARTALKPFADGASFGGYRQKEAKAILDAL